MHFDLVDLHLFIAVADERSITVVRCAPTSRWPRQARGSKAWNKRSAPRS
jgi:hypothetical protein